ncbi:DUF6744 family protein [Kitasatospora purpeofusca]|uniref:DUF6744 family protein n=1 Tax=Kitasatospora purpeofusca TaxID=67352 RepID=UPI0036C1FBB2
MTAQDQQSTSPAADLTTGNPDLDAYTAAMAGDQAPLLGHVVLYSVFPGTVTPDDLTAWFTELDLDPDFLPPALKCDAAFERVTGRDGIRVTYPLDDPTATGRDGNRRRRLPDELGRSAVLMLRPVTRDSGWIVRHVVREVRDERKVNLRYDTRLAAVVFRRDASEPGAGTMTIKPDEKAIAKLPEAEQTNVRKMLAEIQSAYTTNCTYFTGDRLRSLVRAYVEHLGAIKLRPTGGVYFVHHRHDATLAALRELVRRFGHGSLLARVPLPDQDEQREMVIAAFTTHARDELETLAKDLAAARRAGAKQAEVEKLFERYRALQASTAEHSELLSVTLDDTNDALELVKLQLTNLLTTAEEE